MSKYVLQTFRITDSFLQNVRQKATIYLEDINLVEVCVKNCAMQAASVPQIPLFQFNGHTTVNNSADGVQGKPRQDVEHLHLKIDRPT